MDTCPGRRSAPGFWRLCAAALVCAAIGWPASSALAGAAQVRAVELQPPTERTGSRVLVQLSAPVAPKAFALDNPPRLVIDLPATEVVSPLPLPASAAVATPSASAAVGGAAVLGVRVAKRGDGLRLVVDLAAATPFRTRLLPAVKGQPAVLEVELGQPRPAVPAVAVVPKPAAEPPKAVVEAARVAPEAAKTAPEPSKAAAVEVPKSAPAESPRGEIPPVKVARSRDPRAGRDLVIAVDAGHGGKDPGAHGLNGTLEKDVTLAVARRLAAALQREPGMRAYLVRDDDYFVELRQRMVRARKAGADLFVSIHADAAYNRAAAGSSVYILSTRGASSEAARWLADRENAADLAGGVELDKVDPTVASVLMDLSQGDTITSSDRAAKLVLNELDRIGNVHKREVQSAGFMVLKSPDIPSMLVETAFISHPAEEERLADPEHQQRLAEAIQNGLRAYFYNNPPPGTRVAQLAAARRDAGRIAAGMTTTGP